MSFTTAQVKTHLTGMGHGGTLNKVRNIEAMFERSAARFLLKVHPLESIDDVPLASLISDDIFNYALPYNFGSIIDLFPQADRQSWDNSFRNNAGEFDLQKAIRNRTISIEGKGGTKIIRINWRSMAPKVFNTMDSYNGNGTWTAVASASSVATDTITKYTGAGSVRFNVNASGDGIQNTTMTQVDFTNENGIADNFLAVYLGSDYANLSSITPVWGNDLTTKYWTGVAVTTQADGTAFQFGWNIIKAPWSSATQTGTVVPTTIDSYKLTFATTGAGTLANVRVDNLVFTIGKNFDMKFYSKYLFKDSVSGLWISQPDASGEDIVVLDNDTLPLFLLECLTDMAQQMEGTDSAFDINFAEKQLKTLYPAYKGMYPSMVKKVTASQGGQIGMGRRASGRGSYRRW